MPGVARGAGTRLPEVSAWGGGMPEGCLCREEGRAEGIMLRDSRPLGRSSGCQGGCC